MKTFTINDNDAGQRLDKFITKALPELPKGMMYKLIRKKDIKINGRRCEISAKLAAGDIVTVYVKDELAGEKKHDMRFLSAGHELEIVYEDENILVADKPAGLDSHSNGQTSGDTLIDRIKLYLYENGEYSPGSESSFAPALCSRLDRNTCGLVTAVKNAAALREMNRAIREGMVQKIYHCITAAPPPHDEDIITAYHRKDESRNIVKLVNSPCEGYKPIKTGYKVLARKNGLCLVEVTLYTGRTHQIRAHLSSIGAPVLGDGKYGDIRANKRYNVFYQALCAYRLSFSLPPESVLSYLNDVEISAPAPEFERKYF